MSLGACKFLRLFFALGVLLTDTSLWTGSYAHQSQESESSPSSKFSCELSQAQPIWVRGSNPAQLEVGLFRKRFYLSRDSSVRVRIFADTRYEIWIDGNWVGRGPARFSRAYREFDVHELPQVPAGIHQVAVLVQWAPNTRRSESILPYLIGTIEAEGVCIKTDSSWKANLSQAWRRDSALVHAWHLIGPTELLDFSQLPGDWIDLTFDDSSWANAEVKTLSAPITYAPRSIPLLAETKILPRFVEGGFLAKGKDALFVSGTSQIMLYIGSSKSITIETLKLGGHWPTNTLYLNGVALEWHPVGETRVDALYSQLNLRQGVHYLQFVDAPAGTPLLFSERVTLLSFDDLRNPWNPHAGMRNLLPDLTPAQDIPEVSASPQGLTLTFRQAPAYAILDLGRVVHGRVVAEVAGPPGAVVDIGWDERLWHNRPLPFPGSLHPEMNQVDSWRLDGSQRIMSTIDARAGRFLWVSVWSANQPVTLRNLRVLEEHYPFSTRGSFSSNDLMLDKIWRVGVDSLIPNMTDAYTDTPWRERGLWWGDAYVMFKINQVAFGDLALFKRSIKLMGDGIDTNGKPSAFVPGGSSVMILDFGMLWVQGLREYYQISRDLDLLRTYYPALQRLMSYIGNYRNPNTGMLDIPVQHWSQSALIDWSNPYARYGQSAALNSMYFKTLQDAAFIAHVIGRASDAIGYSQSADRVLQGLSTLLFQPSLGLYVETILGGQTLPPSLHAQAWPLSNDAVLPQHRKRVAHGLIGLISLQPQDRLSVPSLRGVQPYGMYWLLRALGESGYVAEGISVIKAYYGDLIQKGATTWWEIFFADQRPTSSLSHGWGGSPTWFLSTYVLGGRQIERGQWLFQPALLPSFEVTGSLPLGDAVLHVSWRREGCQSGFSEIEAPTGHTGTIKLPRSADEVFWNGERVWSQRTALSSSVTLDDEHLLIRPVPPGRHILELRWDCERLHLPLVRASTP